MFINTGYARVNTNEDKELKRVVKKLTGIPMKNLFIQSYGYDTQREKNFIVYGYYKCNYDRVTSRMTYNTVSY
jgi:hypothetical protein